MNSWSRMRKVAYVAIGAAGGAFGFWYASRSLDQRKVYSSWTTNFKVSKCGKWDHNWDHRDPKSLVQPVSDSEDPVAQNRYNEVLDKKKSKVTRHLILVRHGQYNMDGRTDIERYLTEKGRKQAAISGDRLKHLGIDFDKIIRSTMTRAQETAKIISLSLPELKMIDDSMLEEGAPIPPEPPIGHWRPEVSFFEDGARIEAAFRKYFHRAEPDQKQDTYTLVVCHANVIRYFVCRALQLPPEAWLRISLGHASLTWISIMSDGRVTLRTLGETGHIPRELLSR
ncbi:serine/threonine-protein phosphatase Pgam5, mitochondrial isoform X2 [Toxorhynchites rutilus septentrionalis]|uniref:serine/threonine-protein phosphatase Pgam5, mitochondrial isoform X2 n=1 Tax=Toxorhynchites rutilus septentrionalis TaxID=329112 RepID=UPI00247A7084|nr:serine/threonine-protein phosphatase Pgam5, mitochondrial isoform X2 [Toxorhynchites rutilus septentrionalis]